MHFAQSRQVMGLQFKTRCARAAYHVEILPGILELLWRGSFAAPRAPVHVNKMAPCHPLRYGLL